MFRAGHEALTESLVEHRAVRAPAAEANQSAAPTVAVTVSDDDDENDGVVPICLFSFSISQ